MTLAAIPWDCLAFAYTVRSAFSTLPYPQGKLLLTLSFLAEVPPPPPRGFRILLEIVRTIISHVTLLHLLVMFNFLFDNSFGESWVPYILGLDQGSVSEL